MAKSESKATEIIANDFPVEEVEKLVKIKIPKIKGEDTDVFVSINERTWLIQRGVEVEVPRCVFEVLRNQEDALESAYTFESGVQK